MNCEKCGKIAAESDGELCYRCRRLGEILESFSPRIQRDLKTAEFSKNLEQDALEELKKPGGSLYLTGPVGSGKTLFATHLLLKSMDVKGIFGERVFVSVPVLLQEIKHTFDQERRESEEEVIKRHSDAALLVLDDFGVERTTEWVFQVMNLIINHRYENLKRTIFTSNLSIDQLAEKLNDDRIPSRINSMCKVILFDREDLRIKAKREKEKR